MTYVYNGPSYWAILAIAVTAATTVVLIFRAFEHFDGKWDAWHARHRNDPVEDATDDTAAGLVGTWTPPRKWAANGRYLHRVGCEHMTTGELINVWTADAARKWAEGATPRLTGCDHCTPFDTPEPVKVGVP